MKNATTNNSSLTPMKWNPTSWSEIPIWAHARYRTEQAAKATRKSSYIGKAAQALVFLLALMLFLPECFARYANPRFSPDEHSLAFDYCENSCRLVVYSLREGTAVSFSPRGKREDWINPSFAPSSELLAFVISRSPTDVQIATIRPDGTGFALLTSSGTIKRLPSFSPDGKSIIFVGKETITNERGRVTSDDVYTVDVYTREERRITDLRVQQISAPFFLPDGRQFVFGTVGAAYPRSGKPDQKIDLERIHRDRNVFVFPMHGFQELRPYVQGLSHVSLPTPIQTGELSVLVRVNEIDQIKVGYVYDIFLATVERTKRHTSFRSYVRSYGISKTGELVAYVTTSGDGRFENLKLMLWRKKTGASVELRMPALRTIDISY